MQGGTAMNSPLSDLFGQGFILPGGRVINARWYSAMRPCLSISGGTLLFYLWSRVINQGGTARERLCMDIFHGGVFIFKSGGQNEFQ